jgi:DASS family divalent anion:Na+ symporter
MLRHKKLWVGAVALALVFGVAYAKPPVGLNHESMVVLGLLAGAIVFWATRVVDDYIVALGMAVGWVTWAKLPFDLAFKMFTSSTWWLLVSALILGAAVARVGLLRRVAYAFLRYLPKSYTGRNLALIITGVVFCGAIPSTLAKIALAARLVPELGRAMGFEPGDRPMSGLFLSTYLGFVLAAPMFFTATTDNLIIYSFLPKAQQPTLGFLPWFVSMAPLVIFTLVGGFFYVYTFCRPERNVRSGETVSFELPPWTNEERFVAVVLVLSVLLWATEFIHHVPPQVVALGAMVVLGFGATVNRELLNSDVNWGSMLFLGVILNLSGVFPALHIDTYLADLLGPMLLPLAGRQALVLFILFVAVAALRFVFVSMDAIVTLVLITLSTVSGQLGVSIWAIGTAAHLAAHTSFLVSYQNIPLTVGMENSGHAITPRRATPFSAFFMAITVLATLLSIPYWRWLKLL